MVLLKCYTQHVSKFGKLSSDHKTGNVCVLSCVQLFASLWTVAHQALLPMEFSRQEYWSGVSFHTPRDLPDIGIEPMSSVSSALAGRVPYQYGGSVQLSCVQLFAAPLTI